MEVGVVAGLLEGRRGRLRLGACCRSVGGRPLHGRLPNPTVGEDVVRHCNVYLGLAGADARSAAQCASCGRGESRPAPSHLGHATPHPGAAALRDDRERGDQEAGGGLGQPAPNVRLNDVVDHGLGALPSGPRRRRPEGHAARAARDAAAAVVVHHVGGRSVLAVHDVEVAGVEVAGVEVAGVEVAGVEVTGVEVAGVGVGLKDILNDKISKRIQEII